MRTNLIRRVALGALALLTTLTVVAPVQARSPLQQDRAPADRPVPGRPRVHAEHRRPLGLRLRGLDDRRGARPRRRRSRSSAPPSCGRSAQEGINARYFVAHAMLESGWGTSAIARYKRNLFGYNAYDRDPWKYARRFSSHARGVATVAEILRESYLTPGGLRWYGFTTLRGINRYYASDLRWADKVAVLANVIDYLVVTLRERGVRFHRPVLVDQPVVGAPAALDIPWTANPGAQLPDALRFAVRWTPLAVVEASADVPAAAPSAPWRFARRTEGPDHVVRLALKPPTLPGLWRLDVEARDSDGRPLPKTDRPAIRALERPGGGTRRGRGRAVGRRRRRPRGDRVGGGRRAGRRAARSSAERGWTPRRGRRRRDRRRSSAAVRRRPGHARGLDPAPRPGPQPVPPGVGAPSRDARPAAPWTVPVGTPAIPAVVVGRVVVPGAVVAALPTVALADRGDDGRLVLRPLAVASPRDELLLGRPPAPAARTAAVTPRPGVDPGSVEVAVSAGDPAPALDAAVAAVEETPGTALRPGPHALGGCRQPRPRPRAPS